MARSLREAAKTAAGKGPNYEFPDGWRTSGLTPRKQQELHMWREWKDSDEHPDKMEPLLNSLQPLVRKRMNDYTRGVPIRTEVLQSAANKQVIQSLRNYDPTKAKLTTWVTSNLRGLSRFVIANQNMARIVEERSQIIGDYQRARSELSDELGRDPTSIEMADRINQSPERMEASRRQVTAKTVGLLQHEMKKDLLSSGSLDDPFTNVTPREREILKLLQYELDPTELQVYEYILGLHGKPKITSTGQIATMLGWSPSKVSQVKGRIAKKYEEYRFE